MRRFSPNATPTPSDYLSSPHCQLPAIRYTMHEINIKRQGIHVLLIISIIY